ncbi:MAG TPA: glutamine synthetase family protein [Alphaproteobacteria bacterium]
MAKDDPILDAIKKLRSDGVQYVRFELPDLHGTSRSKLVPIDAVESYARGGLNLYGGTLGLDTSSNVVPGCGLNEEINYADTKLFPDFATVRRIPWLPNMARVICDVHHLDGSPLKGSPRAVLKALLAQAAEIGLDVMMGHEFEFYLLDRETRQPLFGGYQIFNTTRNLYVDAVLRMLDQLRAVGIDIITHNCEYAPSQFEINYGPAVGIAAADKAFTFKNAVKELAHREGYLATFMSKPFANSAGSGCHVHVSLLDRKSGANAFLDESDADGLSAAARSFCAGIIAHARAMMPLIGPTPNCYHRLKPHTFAPSNVSWGIEDRTALVRTKASRDKATHHEMRGASAISNPYLSAAAVLAAGLLGLRDKLPLAPEVPGPSEEDASLPKLPQSLEQALDHLEADRAFCELLGADFIKLFTTVKRFELARFRGAITDWERTEYMEIF